MQPKKCVDCVIKNFEMMFGMKPKMVYIFVDLKEKIIKN